MEKIQEIECSKCKKKIAASNKKLHEMQCDGVPQHISMQGLEDQNSNQQYNINSLPINHDGNRIPSLTPSDMNKINNNTLNNNFNNVESNDISDLFYCNKCDIYMPNDEKEDHIYSHQMENTSLQNLENQSRINLTSNLESNLSRTNSLGSNISDDMMHSSNLSGSHSSLDNPQEIHHFGNYRNMQTNSNSRDENTTVTNLPNGGVKTVTYDPNTGMVREVIRGIGFETIITYPRNNPNIRSISTTSTNSNNVGGYSNNHNANPMFPPGFPFSNIGGINSGFSMGVPLGGQQVGFANQVGGGRRNRRSQNNRNDLGQIFGVNNQDFESWMHSILRGFDFGSLNQHHGDFTQLIDELPEMTVDEKSKIPQDKNECMICMSDFQLKEKLKIMPCTHFFHTDCIREWFKNNDTCPICKCSLSEESNQDSQAQ